MELLFSPKARSDLDQIWDYTLEKWGKTQANKYLGAIGKTFDMIAENHLIGSNIGFLRSGYFKIRSGHHLVFYKLADNGKAIEIIRVLHEKMDLPRYLKDLGS